MFELSIAKKYLIPKRKQLSVALISLMSVTVISLVVWLVLVFLSVTDGIEKGWLQKLTALNGPVRITPTSAYFSSYYHQIDSYSAASNFTPRSMAQKAAASTSDPYDPMSDMELPRRFPKPERLANGQLLDPVKQAIAILQAKKLKFQEYEVGGAMLRLEMIRKEGDVAKQSFITQVSYVSSLTDRNPHLSSLLLVPTEEDLQRLAAIKTPDTKIFLPKQFQENGAKVGDKGYLSYAASTASSVQEQRLPILVAGFYDPGIMAIGSKCILAPPDIVHTLNLSNQSFQLDPGFANGIQIWAEPLSRAEEIKKELQSEFQKAGIDKYWDVTSYHDYDFAKDLLLQFQSDKYLFTLIGGIILIVACSNIISLLVLLVNDKKREIGILQAMGAPTSSIAMIFAACGAGMGLLSSIIGIGAALLTLHNIDHIAHFLSMIQGRDAFNAIFYGSSLPNALSAHALAFILIATPLLSLLAGLVPALKACRIRPSAILRSEH